MSELRRLQAADTTGRLRLAGIQVHWKPDDNPPWHVTVTLYVDGQRHVLTKAFDDIDKCWPEMRQALVDTYRDLGIVAQP